ncbi:MAG: asparagine synthetase B [Steroidobacteraceae bacterium]
MRFFGYAGPADGRLAEVARTRDSNPGSDASLPLHHFEIQGSTAACLAGDLAEGQGVAVAVQGGPFWIGDAACVGRTADTAGSLLAGYLESGPAIVRSLRGRFAVVVIDGRSNRVILAVDPMGIERIAYANIRDGVVFSSSAEAVARFPAVGSQLRRQALFDFLLLHMVPAPGTIFEGVNKLRPGTAAICEAGEVRIEHIWRPEFVEHGQVDFGSLRDEMFTILRSAISTQETGVQTGCFLSGGLDSSTVAGVYSTVAGRPVDTYTIGFDEQEYDESHFARLASRQFGTIAHEHHVTPDEVIDAFPRIAAAYDEPFGNSSAVPTFACARIAAADGKTTLLAGDGGDEIFAGNERYARQQVFEAYWRLPASLRTNAIEPLVMRLSPTTRLTPLRKLRSYVEQARIPMPERLEYWNFMFRTELAQTLTAEFMGEVDIQAPLRDMAETYAAAPSTSALHRMHYFDWQYTLSDNDLRKVSTMCELAGIEVRFPMLHPDLVRLANRIAPRSKLRGTRLRHFYKEAVSGFLPNEIINKKKHGFGLPFSIWLRTHPGFADLIYSHLSDLKARGIVRSEFIDRLIEDQRTGHASYFGYAIWDLAMLQAWLAAHD